MEAIDFEAQVRPAIDAYCQKYLDQIKETLLLQIVGFIEDNKNKVEHGVSDPEPPSTSPAPEAEEEAEPLLGGQAAQ